MELDRQAVALARPRRRGGLLGREGDALAEGVDRIGQPLGGDGGIILGDEIAHSSSGSPGIFRRHGMGAEEGGATPTGRSPQRRAARSCFSSLQLQAVAGLDLDRGDALGISASSRGRAAGDQLVLAGRAGRAHGGDDAAAGARDLLVGGAGQPQLELMGAVAAKTRWVWQSIRPGSDPAAFAIDRLAPPRRQARRFAGAGIDDAPVARGDHAVLDRAEAARARPSWRAGRSSTPGRSASGPSPTAFPLDNPCIRFNMYRHIA
jgi:hypothetical protein